MQKFFIVLSVAVTSFAIWCAYSHQPSETCGLNLLNTLLSFELIRMHGKKKT